MNENLKELRNLLEPYRAKGSGISFMRVPLTELGREELICIIVMQAEKLKIEHEQHIRDIKLMGTLYLDEFEESYD